MTTGHVPKAARPTFAVRARRGLVLLVSVLIAAWVGYKVTSQPPTTSARYLGVYEPGTPASYRPVTEFSAATGERPNLLLYYSRWFSAFPTRFASEARAHGAELVVQIQPADISLAKIASGVYDGYLRSYARQLRAFGHPVVIGFAPEMNGGWYSWGAGHVPAATWVAAWQHVVTTVRAAGAANLTWMWTVSRAGTAPVRPYWPGASYVTWVGIDGYFVTPSDTYGSVFGSMVDRVRSFAHEPVLLSGVGVGPATGKKPQDIAAVFSGIAQQRLLGSVWLDVDQRAGTVSQDWRLEGDPAAVAAFRQGVRGTNLAP